jgi:PiT family inorganic phosphate transporter
MDALLSLPIWIGLIGVALVLDFLNGLHDVANSIATTASTRVLKPRYAVIWASFFNFIAFLFFGLHVAQTVGVGIVIAWVITLPAAALIAALSYLLSGIIW